MKSSATSPLAAVLQASPAKEEQAPKKSIWPLVLFGGFSAALLLSLWKAHRKVEAQREIIENLYAENALSSTEKLLYPQDPVEEKLRELFF